MLSREVMGGLALAILWVNTLLVVLAARRELARVGVRLRGLRVLSKGEQGVGLIEGTVVSGDGEGGAIACRRIDQIGRYAADDRDRPAISFADRSYLGASLGGVIEAFGTKIRIDAVDAAEAWIASEEIAKSSSCPSDLGFDKAYEQARKARGFARVVEAPILPGARVWIRGEVRAEEDTLFIAAPEGEAMLVAGIDPRAWCKKKAAFLGLFMLGVLAAAGVCTAIALYPPHFGVVSTIGGALCLAYFLSVQPAGTAARELVREPSRAAVRGSWLRTPSSLE